MTDISVLVGQVHLPLDNTFGLQNRNTIDRSDMSEFDRI
jgi:hypothetical protein